MNISIQGFSRYRYAIGKNYDTCLGQVKMAALPTAHSSFDSLSDLIEATDFEKSCRLINAWFW